MWFPDVVAHLKSEGAEILIAPHGSPYAADKPEDRINHALARVVESGLPMIFVNQVGGQDELVFDGTSFAANGSGKIVARLAPFEEGLVHVELSLGQLTAPEGSMAEGLKAPDIYYAALVLGLRDYVRKNNFPGVLIGLSGGVDSALTAALAVDALGPGNVQAVMMPSRYTSEDSLIDAEACAGALGISYEIIPIESMVGSFSEVLADTFEGQEPDSTEENIQARIRGILLMALSNKFGHMVIATGNKSEFSVGYSTLYGDLCGGFAVLKDVYKTTVYELSKWRNKQKCPGALGPDGPVIPANIITKAPTAELRANQTDQDSLPPYDILDEILKGLVEDDLSVDNVASKGFDIGMVSRIEHMVYLAEYKRRQAPPGVKITERQFGRDRRYPITNAFRNAEVQAGEEEK